MIAPIIKYVAFGTFSTAALVAGGCAADRGDAAARDDADRRVQTVQNEQGGGRTGYASVRETRDTTRTHRPYALTGPNRQASPTHPRGPHD